MPDVQWHEPGRNLVAGDYSGCREIAVDLFGRLLELSGGTFRLEIDEIAADDRRAVSLYVSRARRRGSLLLSQDVGVFELRDGRIVTCRVFHDDQHGWDRFWS